MGDTERIAAIEKRLDELEIHILKFIESIEPLLDEMEQAATLVQKYVR